MNNANLTPLKDLYVMGRRANGSEIECLNLDRLTDADIEAEAAHYEKTRAARMGLMKSDGRPVDVYGSLRGAKSGGLVRDGMHAVTMHGVNLERQAASAGGIANLLRNWGGGKRSGGMIARPIATAAPVKEVDPEARLKQIRDEEAALLQLVAEKKEREAAALNALIDEVSEFSDLDRDTLKGVIEEAKATDLKSAMRAVKAFSA